MTAPVVPVRLAMSLAVALASSVIPDPEQLDHRAPIPTQEEPVAASRADRLTDLPTLEELLAAHPTRALYPSPDASPCADFHPDCAGVKAGGYCDEPRVNYRCRTTCNLCRPDPPPAPPSPPPCDDYRAVSDSCERVF